MSPALDSLTETEYHRTWHVPLILCFQTSKEINLQIVFALEPLTKFISSVKY